MYRLFLAVFAVAILSWDSLAQDKYAVVIGVETYDTSTFENLEFAAEDADGLGNALDGLGFRATVMTSQASSTKLRPTTPEKIASVIKTVVGSCANGDTLLISLSGHGVQFSDEPLLPSGVRETYFCPGDADLSNKRSLVKISDIVRFMNESAASQKLLLVDSCRESVLSEQGQKKSAKRIELGSVHENRRSVPGGMAVLFSCSSGQFSWEHKPIGHSVFTYHVINYLKGDADDRFYDRGSLDLTGLVFYVSKRTNDYVFGKNLTPDGQIPVLRGSSSNWSLGKRLPGSFVNSTGGQMRLIPAGEFMMGSPPSEKDRDEDETQHVVKISKPFYMGTTEVTVGQFKQFVSETGYQTEAERDGDGGYGFDQETGTHEKDPKYNWKNPGFSQANTHPVVNVSWNDAIKFCQWLSRKEGREYSLPTEAQWEYACRAGTTTAFESGSDPESLVQVGNVADGTAKQKFDAWATIDAQDGYVTTAPVGMFRENAFGVFDMHGNVWEWCSDWYTSDYDTGLRRVDPTGPGVGSSRVNRGGSWSGRSRDCRSAYRSRSSPGYRCSVLGFRLVSVIEPGS